MKKTLYLMRGLPGSGKSTEARTICRELDSRGIPYSVAVCSADNYFGWDRYTYVKNFDPSRLPAAHEWCFSHARFAMERETDYVIVDNCNVLNIHMKPYVDIAVNYGYTVRFREPISAIWVQEIRPYLNGKMCNRTWVKNRCQALSDLTQDTHCVPSDSIMRMMFSWEDLDLTVFSGILVNVTTTPQSP